MITSPTKTPLTFSLTKDEPIPSGTLAYYEQRALNNFYSFVLRKFLKSKIRKADLARRIQVSAPQLNRYLASPGNWTIATVQRLLLGIADEEAFLSSESLHGRPPQNGSVLDLLDEAGARPLQIRPWDQPLAAGENETIRAERLEYAKG